MKILIVEDEILQAEILTRMLRSWGHEVVSVDGGQEALDALERCVPDLILLDVFLPDMTAMELIPQIKAIAAGCAHHHPHRAKQPGTGAQAEGVGNFLLHGQTVSAS